MLCCMDERAFHFKSYLLMKMVTSVNSTLDVDLCNFPFLSEVTEISAFKLLKYLTSGFQ